MLKIKNVEPGSIGAELGLNPGDCIIDLNGQPARDILDYYFHIPGETVTVRVKTGHGQLLDFEIEKEYDEDLGLEIEQRVRQCRNKCVFCFIDQQPPCLRKTLYIKDDDYRLSFLYGNYISLTNLNGGDIQRIVQEKLSPLYISVHSTDPTVRAKLLGIHGGPDVMELLRIFSRAGLGFHCQIVLCPGYNDGVELVKTLTDLASLRDSMLSLAVVPVGLTKYRENLPPLRPVDREIARGVIETIADFQSRMQRSMQRRGIYAADEFFLRAGLPIPGAEYYEDFAQLENGIGLIRKSLMQAEELINMEVIRTTPRRGLIVTGTAAAPTLKTIASLIMTVLPDSTIEVLAVENKFLGRQITVAGLLSGADIQAATQTAGEFDIFLVPEVSVRAGCFLDDYTLEDLARVLDKPVRAAADVFDIIEILGNEVLY